MKRFLLTFLAIGMCGCSPPEPPIMATVKNIRLIVEPQRKENPSSQALGGGALGYIIGGKWGGAAGAVIGAASADTSVVMKPVACKIEAEISNKTVILITVPWGKIEECALLRPGDLIKIQKGISGDFEF